MWWALTIIALQLSTATKNPKFPFFLERRMTVFLINERRIIGFLTIGGPRDLFINQTNFLIQKLKNIAQPNLSISDCRCVMGTESPQLHIVFFPFMALGHMIPTIDIAKLFAARGVKSTIVTTPQNVPFVSKTIERTKSRGIKIDICGCSNFAKCHVSPYNWSRMG